MQNCVWTKGHKTYFFRSTNRYFCLIQAPPLSSFKSNYLRRFLLRWSFFFWKPSHFKFLNRGQFQVLAARSTHLKSVYSASRNNFMTLFHANQGPAEKPPLPKLLCNRLFFAILALVRFKMWIWYRKWLFSLHIIDFLCVSASQTFQIENWADNTQFY